MTNSAPGTAPEINPIQFQIDQLGQVQKQLKSQKMSRGQTLAIRRKKREQQQAMVELGLVKDNITMFGTLADIAAQINFQTCTLSVDAIRGALLDILDKSSNAEAVSAFERRNEHYLALKRRNVAGVRGFLAAADPSAELAAAARENKLRYDRLAGGYAGTADIDVFVNMAVTFQASVRVAIDRELVELVTGGVVNTDTLELAKAVTGQLIVDTTQLATGKVEQSDVLAAETALEATTYANSTNSGRPQRPILQSRSSDAPTEQ